MRYGVYPPEGSFKLQPFNARKDKLTGKFWSYAFGVPWIISD